MKESIETTLILTSLLSDT